MTSKIGVVSSRHKQSGILLWGSQRTKTTPLCKRADVLLFRIFGGKNKVMQPYTQPVYTMMMPSIAVGHWCWGVCMLSWELCKITLRALRFKKADVRLLCACSAMKIIGGWPRKVGQ